MDHIYRVLQATPRSTAGCLTVIQALFGAVSCNIVSARDGRYILRSRLMSILQFLINAVDRGRKIVRASKIMQILPIFAMYPHVIVVKQRGF